MGISFSRHIPRSSSSDQIQPQTPNILNPTEDTSEQTAQIISTHILPNLSAQGRNALLVQSRLLRDTVRQTLITNTQLNEQIQTIFKKYGPKEGIKRLIYFLSTNENLPAHIHLNLSKLQIRDTQLNDLFTKLPDTIKNRITELDLWNNQDLTDEGFDQIAQLPNLTKLSFPGGEGITDRTCAKVSELLHLTDLKIGFQNNMTDIGLSSICKLSQLKSLELLECNNISERGLMMLSQLSNLEHLFLYFNPTQELPSITDRALEAFSHLTQLHFLKLCFCEHITDQGLTNLSQLSRLTKLSLSFNHQTTADGMRRLFRSLPQLHNLYLSYFECINDSNTNMFNSLQNLSQLDLYKCKHLSETAHQELKNQLPLVKIIK